MKIVEKLGNKQNTHSKTHTCSGTEMINMNKTSIQTKLIYIFNVILTSQFQKKINYKFLWNHERAQMATETQAMIIKL